MGQGGPILRLQVHINDSFWVSGNSGGCLLTSHKAGRQAGGLHVPAWRPGVVGQAGGTLRDQAKISTLKSFSSRWGLAPASVTSLKSFLKKVIKLKVALLCFLYYRD